MPRDLAVTTGALHPVRVAVRHAVDRGEVGEARPVGERRARWADRGAHVDDLPVCGQRVAVAEQQQQVLVDRRDQLVARGRVERRGEVEAVHLGAERRVERRHREESLTPDDAGLPPAGCAGTPAGSRRPTSRVGPNDRAAAGTRRGGACRMGPCSRTGTRRRRVRCSPVRTRTRPAPIAGHPSCRGAVRLRLGTRRR